VKVGDELEVTIEAVGVKGDGIAKKDGFVLFIPNTKAGQKLKIRVTKVLRKVGFAEAVGGATAAPAADAPAEAPAAEQAPAEEPAAEDSEDFGDEQQETPQ
jgi:predicted RNA-binding protein with TRAM domain